MLGMLPNAQVDWQIVVDRQPKGYVELNDGKYATYGPLEKIEIEGNEVLIHVKWKARRPLGEYGIPCGNWEVLSRVPVLLMRFPNKTAPYVIETVPRRGERVRFSTGNDAAHLLYIGDVSKGTLEQAENDHSFG